VEAAGTVARCHFAFVAGDESVQRCHGGVTIFLPSRVERTIKTGHAMGPAIASVVVVS
jgi:hypothetical protein